MSDHEILFIRETRKMLMKIFIPVTVAIILSVGAFVIAAPFRIKSNEKEIEAIKKSYVSSEEFALYMNNLRESNTLMRQSLDNNVIFNREEFDRVNKRMDSMIRDMVSFKTRGGKPIEIEKDDPPITL